MNDTPMNTSAPKIVVTSRDFERLQRVISSSDTANAEELDLELARAEVVSEGEIAGDIVTMNSDVIYEDLSTGAQRSVRVVYPEDADLERSWISVLAPLGSALLGLRVGQEIDWRMPSRVRRLRIIRVPYQPEANGGAAP